MTSRARRRPTDNEQETNDMDNATPNYFLTYSEAGWTVSAKSHPLCNHKATCKEAIDVANHFNIVLAEKFWNGTTGSWQQRKATD